MKNLDKGQDRLIVANIYKGVNAINNLCIKVLGFEVLGIEVHLDHTATLHFLNPRAIGMKTDHVESKTGSYETIHSFLLAIAAVICSGIKNY